MDKQQIIARFKEAVGQIETIKESEFAYDMYVSKTKTDCATVCCIVGWYPRFFPKDWTLVKNRYPELIGSSFGYTRFDIEAYHGFREELVDALFYAGELKTTQVILNEIDDNSTLPVVKERFVRVLELLEHGTELDEFLIIE